MSKKSSPTARIFFIMQYLKHPVTGEDLITEDKIQEALDHRTIKRWAYALHDKDVWTEEDELEDSNHPAGHDKPPHYHVCIELPKNSTEVNTIARWFGIPPNFVEIKRGHGAFLDCVEYLTHEHPNQQEIGKHLYLDEEVKANFDFREALNERAISKAKYGVDEMSQRDRLRIKVLSGELSLNDVRTLYPINYTSDLSQLQKLRNDYLANEKPPRIRHNFYVCGGGGVGKGVASVCLAHALFPDVDDEDRLIFRVGSAETAFLGYDGQPVIIWDDYRAGDLIKVLGSRGNVFNVFDTTPKKATQHVKFGHVNLINAVNIVNSVQPWNEFLDALVGEYTDGRGVKHNAEMNEKSQSYRRFPFIMPLRASDFDILINKGYLDDTDELTIYKEYRNIQGNFGMLAKMIGVNDDENKFKPRTKEISSKMVRPLVTSVEAVEAKEVKRSQTVEFSEEDMKQLDTFGMIRKRED